MENIKMIEQFFVPDCRSEALSPPLEDQYKLLDLFRLHDGVPDSVRSYMNSVVTLWLYGWLHYPFYPIAIFLSTTAVEMALQERFPERRREGLKKLLQTAKNAGLISDDGFPSLVERRETAAILSESSTSGIEVSPMQRPQKLYVDEIIESLPKVRNRFAHPKGEQILPPGMAVDSLVVTSEIINQLWPRN